MDNLKITREQRKVYREFFVADKIAKEIDQTASEDLIKYWTEDSIEYQLKGLENNQKIPNSREEVQILEVFQSLGILNIKDNHSEYE